MKPVTVVVAIPDSSTNDALTASLRSHFRVVLPATPDHIRTTIVKHRADVLLVDLESTAPDAIRSLLDDFGAVSVVCIHRLADDRLWSAALSAGALDCCHPSDVRGIVLAVNRDGKLAQGHAA